MSDSKIKSKIAALLAKAKGTDNEHEAETFLAKVQELLEKHQLDMSDLEDADDPVRQDSGLDATKWTPSWHAHLYRHLGLLYGCYSVKRRVTATGYYQELVGRESAIVTTQIMFDWIKGECNRLGRELYASNKATSAANGARLVGNALVTRIARLIPKDDAPRTEAAAKNALVTKSRVMQVVEEHYGKLSTGRGGRTKTSASAREMAAGIGLHRQAGGSSTKALA